MNIKHYILSLVAILTLGMLTSCDDHEYTMPETTYRVGDLVLTDGDIIHIEDYDSTKHQVAAVIFDNNRLGKYSGGGYAVMLKETSLLQFADTLVSQSTTADTVGVEAYNGYSNTISMNSAKSKAESPLAKAVLEYFPYNQSAFIPCLYEFQMLYRTKTKVNESLKKVGGDVISDNWYWTSTEVLNAEDSKAWTISMSSGRTIDAVKTQAYATRPIIKINESLTHYSE